MPTNPWGIGIIRYVHSGLDEGTTTDAVMVVWGWVSWEGYGGSGTCRGSTPLSQMATALRHSGGC